VVQSIKQQINCHNLHLQDPNQQQRWGHQPTNGGYQPHKYEENEEMVDAEADFAKPQSNYKQRRPTDNGQWKSVRKPEHDGQYRSTYE